MKEEKKEVDEKPKTVRNYKEYAFIIFCILGVSIFICYYFLFQKNFLEEEKQSITLDKIISSTDIAPKKEVQVSQISKKIQEYKCTNIDFYRKYLLLKNMADSGEDYSSEAIDLSKQNSPFNDLVLELLSLAKENKSDYYFSSIFEDLADFLYDDLSDDHIYNEFSKSFIRVKKIGKRAIEGGGLDKYIAITKDALNNGDLVVASKAISMINDSNNVLKEFKYKLSKRIRIKSLIKQIDQRIIIGEEK